MNTEPLVSVCMITYNHEYYIQEAIEGVLMQKTSFNFELVIGEDCSSDNTRALCEGYSSRFPDMIELLPSKENLGVKRNFLRTLKSCKGKYIAICEGDDYWNDPNKLQKQVDFLEENNEYGLVATRRSNFNQKTKHFSHPDIDETIKFYSYSFEDILLGQATIATLTAMFRKELFEELLILNENSSKKLSFLDYCLWTFFSYKAKVAVLNSITAVYRMLPESMTHTGYQEKWNLKKQYYSDFKIYRECLSAADSTLFEKAEYQRAKGYYPLALKANDRSVLQEFVKILKRNNDILNYCLLKAVLSFSLLRNVVFYINKVIVMLSRDESI